MVEITWINKLIWKELTSQIYWVLPTMKMAYFCLYLDFFTVSSQCFIGFCWKVLHIFCYICCFLCCESEVITFFHAPVVYPQYIEIELFYTFTLYPETLLNSFINSKNCSWFCIWALYPHINLIRCYRDNFISFKFACVLFIFIFHYSLFPWMGYPVAHSIEMVREDIVDLLLILRWPHSVFITEVWWHLEVTFPGFRKFFSYLAESFYEAAELRQMLFLHLLSTHMVFLLSFVNVMNCIEWF